MQHHHLDHIVRVAVKAKLSTAIALAPSRTTGPCTNDIAARSRATPAVADGPESSLTNHFLRQEQ